MVLSPKKWISSNPSVWRNWRQTATVQVGEDERGEEKGVCEGVRNNPELQGHQQNRSMPSAGTALAVQRQRTRTGASTESNHTYRSCPSLEGTRQKRSGRQLST